MIVEAVYVFLLKLSLFSLKEYLPKEYVKNRGVDKKIFAEHKQLHGLKELDAKARYTRNCRELKTYGVSFFLVKVSCKTIYYEHMHGL